MRDNDKNGSGDEVADGNGIRAEDAIVETFPAAVPGAEHVYHAPQSMWPGQQNNQDPDQDLHVIGDIEEGAVGTGSSGGDGGCGACWGGCFCECWGGGWGGG